MSDKREKLLEFLQSKGIRSLGFEDDFVPSAHMAWRYMARKSVIPLEKISEDDIEELDNAFCRSAEQLSIFGKGSVLLSVSGFGCPWIRVAITSPRHLVQRVCVYADEPWFIVLSEVQNVILSAISLEWHFRLAAARWTPEGVFVPITSADFATG